MNAIWLTVKFCLAELPVAMRVTEDYLTDVEPSTGASHLWQQGGVVQQQQQEQAVLVQVVQSAL